jgi:hypothetical protein
MKSMYSPKIDETLVKRLYALKVGYTRIGLNMPMTRIVKDALTWYLPKAEKKVSFGS